MIDEITLNNGEKVRIKPKISIKALRVFQDKGLLPESLLQAFVGADKEPKKMEPYLINSTWIAYLNANPDTKMSQDDFEDKLDLDFEQSGKILTEMISGSAKADARFANGFKRSSKKGNGKDRKRKHRK